MRRNNTQDSNTPPSHQPIREGNILEVFSSIQGEGLHVGERHLFVRFTGCNLRCRFCDTEKAFDPAAHCRIAYPREKGGEILLTNPPAPQQLADHLEALDSPPIHAFVSLTGGEPLLHAGYLERLLPLLGKGKRRVLLETNGTLADPLAAVLRWVDVISMDWKLPSATGETDRTEEHSAFLRAARGKNLFLKVVITHEVTDEELEVLLSQAPQPPIPLVLQPVTPAKRGIQPPSGERLLHAQALLSSAFHPVRVIPQIHPLLGIP